MISQDQSSFIPCRAAENNYIVAYEILHSMKGRKDGRGLMTLKIDLEKACDRLEWDFILDMLIHHTLIGTPIILSWGVYILCLLQLSLMVIQLSSSSFLGILARRPCLPYIFIMCMEHLPTLLKSHVLGLIGPPSPSIELRYKFFISCLQMIFSYSGKQTLKWLMQRSILW